VNGMHHFDPSHCAAGGPKGLEAEQGTREPFHGSVVLFHHIVEILRLPNDNGRLVELVVVVNRRGVAPTLVNRDLLRESSGADRLA
jgi:hypothetical protein